MQDLDDLVKSDLTRLEKLTENFRWFNSHYENLKKEYTRQHVAVEG